MPRLTMPGNAQTTCYFPLLHLRSNGQEDDNYENHGKHRFGLPHRPENLNQRGGQPKTMN